MAGVTIEIETTGNQTEYMTYEEAKDWIFETIKANPSNCAVFEYLLDIPSHGLLCCKGETTSGKDRLDEIFEIEDQLRQIHFPVCSGKMIHFVPSGLIK